MTISNYFFDGGLTTVALVTQGTVVPSNVKRKVSAAIVTNTTGAAKTFTATVKGSTAATAVTVISARTINPGESYTCPELVGRGMNTGGQIQVVSDVAGLDFKYEAYDITNG